MHRAARQSHRFRRPHLRPSGLHSDSHYGRAHCHMAPNQPPIFRRRGPINANQASLRPSLLNLKFVSNFFARTGFVHLEAEPPDRRKDLVGGLDPFVGLRVLVVRVDE